MTTDAQLLAKLAEIRIWKILINTDEEVRGLDPSRVVGHACARVNHLEAELPGMTTGEQDDELDAASQRDRDRAFGHAALNMRRTLDLIKYDLEGSAL